jgi:hypothetical protein
MTSLGPVTCRCLIVHQPVSRRNAHLGGVFSARQLGLAGERVTTVLYEASASPGYRSVVADLLDLMVWYPAFPLEDSARWRSSTLFSAPRPSLRGQRRHAGADLR